MGLMSYSAKRAEAEKAKKEAEAKAAAEKTKAEEAEKEAAAQKKRADENQAKLDRIHGWVARQEELEKGGK